MSDEQNRMKSYKSIKHGNEVVHVMCSINIPDHLNLYKVN